MDGRKVLKYLKDMGIKLDLIYLDMDHEYEPVLGDLKEICKYFPDVPIIGDDILYHKGVGRAVKEFLATACSQYFLEVDQNAYALIPKSDKFKPSIYNFINFNIIIHYNIKIYIYSNLNLILSLTSDLILLNIKLTLSSVRCLSLIKLFKILLIVKLILKLSYLYSS